MSKQPRQTGLIHNLLVQSTLQVDKQIVGAASGQNKAIKVLNGFHLARCGELNSDSSTVLS